MAAAHIDLFAHKSKQVNAIHRQLVSDFHPAVKNVAQAGQNLLKAFQNLSRNHYIYTASLYALAFSGSSADVEARAKAGQLEKIVEAMKTIYEKQTEWMDHFTKTSNTVNQNCKNEKERLKSLQSEFSKREKALNKAVDKGKEKPVELGDFYGRELALMRDQQSQRYLFFVEKHFEVLRHYFEWARFSSLLLEREFGFVGAKEENEVEEEEENGEKEGDGYFFGEKRNATGIKVAANSDAALTAEPFALGAVQQHNVEPKRQEFLTSINGQHVNYHQQQHRRGSSSQQAPQIPTKNIYEARQQLQIPSSPNQQQQQGLFRPIPVLPKNQQKFRHSLADVTGHAFVHQQQQAAFSQIIGGPSPSPSFERHGRGASNFDMGAVGFDFSSRGSSQQFQQFYRDVPSPPRSVATTAHLDQVGIEEAIKNERREEINNNNDDEEEEDGVLALSEDNKRQRFPFQQAANTMRTKAPVQPHQHQQQPARPPFFVSSSVALRGSGGGGGHYAPVFHHQKPLSPLVTANGSTNNNNNINNNIINNNNSLVYSSHTRAQSEESTASSSVAARFTPPIFSASDYGRLVQCTTPYESQGESQLSLGMGEQILLLKSGTRGWVLGRSEDGLRHGWFPAKYLKLV